MYSTISTLSILLIFNAVLVCSICLRRIYLHPFSQVPGPLLAQITNAYSAYHAARRDTHVVIHGLHEKYGPVVRYGPDRILFNSRQSMKEIYGRKNNLFKGRAYNAMKRAMNCMLRGERSSHKDFQAVNASSRAENPQTRCELLQSSIRTRDFKRVEWTEPRETTQWSAFFAIDLIADLTVGQNTTMLTSPENRIYNPARKANFARMGLAMQWPEAFCGGVLDSAKIRELLFPKIATLGIDWHRLLSSWIQSRLQALRSAKEFATANDMIVAISRYRDPETGRGLNDGELTAEMTTLLIAGSGTITTGMTSLLWCLFRSPGSYRKAVQEVRDIFDTPQSIGMNILLTKCIYLRACLHEAMRVSPAPTTPLYREASPGGAVICGIHIPEGYEVATTIYALQHNESYHPDSFTFDPERWLQDQEKVQETKAAWAPFSVGERNCVGMKLATKEILITIATILWHGDFRTADDPMMASIGAGSARLGPGRHRKKEFQLYDTFGASTEGPYLQFKRRILA